MQYKLKVNQQSKHNNTIIKRKATSKHKYNTEHPDRKAGHKAKHKAKTKRKAKVKVNSVVGQSNKTTQHRIEHVTILAIFIDDMMPFYTVEKANGRVVQTISERLIGIIPNKLRIGDVVRYINKH